MNKLAMQISEAFYRQSRREQLIILAGGACLLLYAVWFLFAAPLRGAVVAERAKTAAVSQSLARVQTLAATIENAKNQQGNERQPKVSLAELVDRSLRAHGLVMQGFQPSGDNQVRLRLDNASYASVVRWLHELETVQGVQVQELATSASQSPGLVMVNVRLRKGS